MRLYENSNLCEILKNKRHESKLSQEQLAEKIGCSRITISRIENEQDLPSYKIFYRWITACGNQLILRSHKIGFAKRRNRLKPLIKNDQLMLVVFY